MQKKIKYFELCLKGRIPARGRHPQFLLDYTRRRNLIASSATIRFYLVALVLAVAYRNSAQETSKRRLVYIYFVGRYLYIRYKNT